MIDSTESFQFANRIEALHPNKTNFADLAFCEYVSEKLHKQKTKTIRTSVVEIDYFLVSAFCDCLEKCWPKSLLFIATRLSAPAWSIVECIRKNNIEMLKFLVENGIPYTNDICEVFAFDDNEAFRYLNSIITLTTG